MAKVLLVEDDKFLVRVFEVKLKKEGFQTLLMENGVGVEEAVKKEKPDVIVLDLVMPARDGFETLNGLKADSQTKNVPVIVVTALNSPEDRKICLDAGAKEYLVKDAVTMEEIVGVIRKYAR